MGNSSRRGPKTEKTQQTDGNSYLLYGLCEMQGWRGDMEDATIAAVDFDINSSIFGVLDGHGGPIISKFVASNFVSLFTHMKSYKLKNYEQALIETFLKFDELLRLEKVNLFLQQNSSSKKDSKLDVNFSYGTDNSEKTLKNTKYRDKYSHHNAKTEYSEHKDPSFPVPKENILDLTKKNSKDIKDGNSSSNSSSSNTYSSDPKSNSKSKSKDTPTADQNKIEINLKISSDDVTDALINGESIEEQNSNSLFDELIAKEMGTTCNIVLIKNNYIYIANVGDSLAVMFKNGTAIRLNQEHKTTLPSEFTRITKSGLKIINNRIEGRLNLTRAIGDLRFKQAPNLKFYEQAVTAYPEITKMKISNDMDFIILACDGVWDCVDPQKLCEFVSLKLKKKTKICTIIAEMFDQILSKTNNNDADIFDKAMEKWASIPIANEDELISNAENNLKYLSCGFTGFLIMQGVMREMSKSFEIITGDVYCNCHPTYYGMMVVSFKFSNN